VIAVDLKLTRRRSRFLLDADVLSHFWAGNQRVVQRIFEAAAFKIGITSITKAEVLRRRCENLLKAESPAEMLKAQDRLDVTETRLASLLVVPFDTAAAEKLEQLLQVDRLKRIGRADVLIASIAMANDATLVTRNLKHFHQVPRLSVVNWVDE
jgi:tRNA(fMet)-specific endonuclease VapC